MDSENTKERIAPKCESCNKSILIKRSRDYNKKFCNPQCSGRNRARKNRCCVYCETEFYPKFTEQKLCSKKCSNEAQRSAYTKQCEQCNKDFILNNKAYERRGGGRFCSVKCSTRKFNFKEDMFLDVDTSDKAYWLGFLLADGYNDYTELVINLSSKDTEHLKKFKTFMQSEHPIKLSDGNRVSFRIASLENCENLKKHGMVKAKSFILEAPKIKEELCMDLIRGFFDGDGCIYLYKKEGKIKSATFSIYCESPQMIKWIFDKMEKAGINYINVDKTERNISIHKQSELVKIYNLLYKSDSERLQRKYQKFTEVFEWANMRRNFYENRNPPCVHSSKMEASF